MQFVEMGNPEGRTLMLLKAIDEFMEMPADR